MFECPHCTAQYSDATSAGWCRDICAEDERVARAALLPEPTDEDRGPTC